jgi:hypothetical protein
MYLLEGVVAPIEERSLTTTALHVVFMDHEPIKIEILNLL